MLEKPDQYLEDGDEDSLIRLRPAIVKQIRAVLFHSDVGMNSRTLKKSLKEYKIESCDKFGDGKSDFVVVFENAEGDYYLVPSKGRLLAFI